MKTRNATKATKEKTQYLWLVYLSDYKKLLVRGFNNKNLIDDDSLYGQACEFIGVDYSQGVCQTRQISTSVNRTISDFKRSIVKYENPDYKTLEAIAF